MAKKTYKDSPQIRAQWEEWMRPWTYCSGCSISWPDYMGQVLCQCEEEE